MENDLASYKIFVEIFKGYLDTALTANIWFYSLTGAVVANYLSKKEQQSYLHFSLVVPFCFGIALTIISGFGIWQALDLRDQVQKAALGLQIQGAPPVEILILFLGVTSMSSLLICFGLACLFMWWPKKILGNKERPRIQT